MKVIDISYYIAKMDYVTAENKDGYFTANEQKDLRKDRVEAKVNDTDYLSAHPEVELIIQELYTKILNSKPKSEDIYLFVARYCK